MRLEATKGSWCFSRASLVEFRYLWGKTSRVQFGSPHPQLRKTQFTSRTEESCSFSLLRTWIKPNVRVRRRRRKCGDGKHVRTGWRMAGCFVPRLTWVLNQLCKEVITMAIKKPFPSYSTHRHSDNLLNVIEHASSLPFYLLSGMNVPSKEINWIASMGRHP